VAHGLCSSGLFCLSNITYERFSRRSLLVNKGLINLIPRMSGTAIIIVADVKYARVSTSIPTVNM